MDTASTPPKIGPIRRSLGAQAALLILAITVLTLGSTTLLSTHIDAAYMHSSMQEAAGKVYTLLRVIIDKPMVIGADEKTRAEFAFLTRQFPDVHLAIAGFDEKVTYSSNPGETRKPLTLLLQDKLPAEDRQALLGNYRDALQGRSPEGRIVSLDGRKAYLHIAPILNSPECHHCHGSSQPVLGAMSVLQDVENRFVQANRRSLVQIVSALTGGVLLIIGIYLFIRRRIINRLSRLEETSNAILSGETDIENSIRGQDELGRVAGNLISYLKLNFQKIGVGQSVLRGLTIPAMMCDTNKRITYVNAALLDLLRISGKPADLLGSPADSLLYGMDQAPNSIFTQVLRQSAVCAACEAEVRRGDGKTLIFRLDANPVTDLREDLIGVFVCILDLTAIRAHEATMLKHEDAMTRTADEARVLTEEIQQAVAVLADQVESTRMQTARQQALSDETVRELDQINDAMGDVSGNSAHVAEQAGVTRQSAEGGALQASRVSSGMADVVASINVLKKQMEELGEKTEGIDVIMRAIQDIADQTNLLALNAAIEAARAGEAGRGFSVVADEVRKLAEKTMQATVEVARTVKEIHNSAEASIMAVDSSVDSVNASSAEVQRTGDVLQQILGLADSVASKVQEIAAAMQQQAASIKNVHGSIHGIRTIAEEAATATSGTEKAVRSLMGIAERLNAIMAGMTGGGKQ